MSLSSCVLLLRCAFCVEVLCGGFSFLVFSFVRLKIPQNFFEFLYFFVTFFGVFVDSRKLLDTFGHVRTRSDAFGCVQM